MSEHTPGPWRREVREAGTWLIGTNGRNAVLVLRTDTQEGRATLSLVESVLEMKAALKALSAQAKLTRPSSLMVPLIADADEAVAKAEGR